jgi:trigger factor
MDFKSSIEETSEATRSISIEIPRAIYQDKFNKLLNKAVSNSRLKGFRPGRAPKAHVAKIYGAQIHSDVIGDLVSNAYQNVIKDENLHVVGTPQFDIDDKDTEKDLNIKATVSIVPEPELKDYRGISFEFTPEVYSKEEFEKRLNAICEQQSKIEAIEDRKIAELGDLAMVDYEASVDEKPLAGGSAKDSYVEIGKDGYAKEVGLAVVGLEIGQEKTAEIILSDSYPEESRGKTAIFHIQLKGLYSKNQPEVSDEVAKNSGLAEDVEGLKTYIKNTLEKEIDQINKSRKEEAFIEAVYKANEFEIPQGLVDEEIRMMLFEFGILNPRDEKSYRADLSRFREMFSEKGRANAKRSVIIAQLEKQETPQADKEVVEEWLNERSQLEGRTREEIDKYYQFPEQLDQLKAHVARIKLLEELIEAGLVKEQKAKKAKKKKETKKETK